MDQQDRDLEAQLGHEGSRGGGSGPTPSLRKNNLTLMSVPHCLPPTPGHPQGPWGRLRFGSRADKCGVAPPPNSRMAPASPSVRPGLSLFLCKPGQMTRPSRLLRNIPEARTVRLWATSRFRVKQLGLPWMTRPCLVPDSAGLEANELPPSSSPQPNKASRSAPCLCPHPTACTQVPAPHAPIVPPDSPHPP